VFYLYPAYIAWNYYGYIALMALAVIQAAASVSGLRGLLIGGRVWPRRVALRGLAVVALLATAGFVHFSPDLLTPGLAGSELMLVFGAGVLTAMVVSMLAGLAGRRPPSGGAIPRETREYALPAAGYTYRLWDGSRPDGRMVIVLTDPDLPEASMLPLCRKATASGFPCVLVQWGPEGVPSYPDALAVVPMCISSHGGEEGRAFVVGAGAAADLALRSAADDERVEGVLAVAPALTTANLVQGVRLLSSMNVVDAWRRYHSWDRRAFVKALRGHEALARVGKRARVLSSPDDGLFLVPGFEERTHYAGVQWRVIPGLPHYALVEGEAEQWLEDLLTGMEVEDCDRPG